MESVGDYYENVFQVSGISQQVIPSAHCYPFNQLSFVLSRSVTEM